MEGLKPFLDHDDPIIANIAKEIDTLYSDVTSGKLTEDQFKELVDDMLEVDKIRRLSETLERKIMIAQTYYAIKELIGIL